VPTLSKKQEASSFKSRCLNDLEKIKSPDPTDKMFGSIYKVAKGNKRNSVDFQQFSELKFAKQEEEK
jgi:hypothetical protein